MGVAGGECLERVIRVTVNTTFFFRLISIIRSINSALSNHEGSKLIKKIFRNTISIREQR